MLNRIFVVDSVTLSSTGTAVSSYVPWEQTTRKLTTQVVVKATGQGAYVRLSNDASAATNVDVLVQGGDHVVLSVQGRRWVSVLSDGASSTVSVGALSTGVSGSAASLDLAFAGAATLDPLVTFTRASTATRFDQNGVLQTVASDVARSNNNQDYDPVTLAPRGFLVEEQRTNSIRNNTMVGAVAGTPGTMPTNWQFTTSTVNGITRTVVGTGTENGITYVDIQYAGTAVGAGNVNITNEINTQISAVQNQVWTFTCYAKLVAGSFANTTARVLYVNSFTAAGAFDANGASPSSNFPVGGPTSAALNTQRYFYTATLASATTVFVNGGVFITYNAGAVIDFTIRIGLPQLELGAFATSVIPTTTTALTRAQDRAVVNTLSPWYNSVAGTFYAEFAVTQPSSGANQFLARVSNNSYNNQIGDFVSTTGFAAISTASGGVFDGLASTAIAVSANTVAKFAGAYAANDLAACKDGGTVATDSTATIPSGLTRFDLGSDHAGFNNVKAGYLRRVTYYPRRLTNAELQAITA